ncbi:MAG: hypothetical protein ABEI07_02735 [Candidatus Nanohaloarchaea archaeon]
MYCDRVRKLLVPLLMGFLVAAPAAGQPRMESPVDSVELGFSESASYPLLLHNPLGQPDTYDIGVGTVMSEGSVAVMIEGKEKTSDRVRVEMGPGENRTVIVHYTPATCPSSTCTGTATFIGRSLETDKRFTDLVRLVVERESKVYGSPGITSVQAVLAGLLAALVSVFLS